MFSMIWKYLILHGHSHLTMPEKFTGGLGLEGAMALKNYVENGGRIVALDESSEFVIEHFGLPVTNALDNISSSQFFIPGSLVGIDIDTTFFITNGLPQKATASFVRSRAFDIVKLSTEGEGGRTQIKEPPSPTIDILARYAKNNILQSGWALGEDKYLAGKPAIVRLPVGQGDVVLFGFRPQFRGQPRGTYRLLFNSLIECGIDDN